MSVIRNSAVECLWRYGPDIQKCPLYHKLVSAIERRGSTVLVSLIVTGTYFSTAVLNSQF